MSSLPKKDSSAVSGSYAPVASDYYDVQAHPTCANFNRLSRKFIHDHFPLQRPGGAILEVGAGRSSVAELLSQRGESLAGLTITDACADMLAYSAQWEEQGAVVNVADACALDVDSDSVALLVAGLGDPYNTQPFWLEAARVLSAGADMIFTLPAFEWAVRFRKGFDNSDFHSAEFTLSDGEKVSVPSYIPTLDIQMDMIETAGLIVTGLQTLGWQALGDGPLSPKVEVFEEKPYSIVTGIKVRKPTAVTAREVRSQWRESFRAALRERPDR